MWYVQVNQGSPRRIDPTRTPPRGESKWIFQISSPHLLEMLYIFSPMDVVRKQYIVEISIGSLPAFCLGLLTPDTPALQTEPNFKIQRAAKCILTISQDSGSSRHSMGAAGNEVVAVNSFNAHFQHFMDAIQHDLSGVFMAEMQREMATKKQLSGKGEIDSATMFALIKKLHSHVQSAAVNPQFKRAMLNVAAKLKGSTPRGRRSE